MMSKGAWPQLSDDKTNWPEKDSFLKKKRVLFLLVM